MNPPKYFDCKTNRNIDLDKDGCDLNDWKQQHGKSLYAKHPSGFPIFVSPEDLEVSNEYSESDPYTVERNIEGEFHQRRIECTLEMLREACDSIQGSQKILDLGCGQGHITNKILKAFPSAEISGLDYSVSAVESAVKRFNGIDFAVGDAYACPYAEKYFDVVVCNNLWEHVPDPLFLLRGITRILKDNGFIVISTPSRYRLENLVGVLRGRKVQFMSENHVTEYSVGQVVEQLVYGGYRVCKVYSKPIRTWGLKSYVANALFSGIIALVGSHHQLESTVFYLAQKTDERPKIQTGFQDIKSITGNGR